MIRAGIDGKLFRVIRSLYDDVKLCVKHMNSLSDFYNSDIGLLQGEIMSPILFSIFVNDIEMYMQQNNSGLTLEQLSIYLLLFADDAVIVSDSAVGLQKSLDSLYKYCDKWKLKVNTSKTKVMIFRKSGRYSENIKFYYNGAELDIVPSFNY